MPSSRWWAIAGVEPVVDGPPVGEPGELVGVGQAGDALQVLDLRGAGGDLAGDREREVEVLGAVRLVPGVAGGEQLAPDPPLEHDRDAHAGALAEVLEQGDDGTVVAGSARVGTDALDVGLRLEQGLDARVVGDRVDLVGPSGCSLGARSPTFSRTRSQPRSRSHTDNDRLAAPSAARASAAVSRRTSSKASAEATTLAMATGRAGGRRSRQRRGAGGDGHGLPRRGRVERAHGRHPSPVELDVHRRDKSSPGSISRPQPGSR